MREEIKSYLLENEITQAAFADMIRVNRGTVNQYLSGKHTADSARAKIEEGYERIKTAKNGGSALKEEYGGTVRRTQNYSGGLLMTEDAQGVISVCRITQEAMDCGLVIGKSGFGKTYTLKYYAQGTKVVYIECNVMMGVRDILRRLENALKLPHFSGTNDERARRIKEFLFINPGYLLIFDEADKLMTKYTQQKLEAIRYIGDETPVGIVFAGEPALKGEIERQLKRVIGRTGAYYELMGMSSGEAREYIGERALAPEAEAEIINRATNTRYGSFRILHKTLRNVDRVSGGGLITSDTVRQACAMMPV